MNDTRLDRAAILVDEAQTILTEIGSELQPKDGWSKPMEAAAHWLKLSRNHISLMIQEGVRP